MRVCTLLLAAALPAAPSWLNAAPRVGVNSRPRPASWSLSMSAIEATRAAAAAQRDEYYAMAPWEKQITFKLPGGRPTTLDLRGFIQPFNRSGVKLAGLLVTQDGIPGITAGGGKQNYRYWRPVGAIAALDEASLPLAVARQRDLILAWSRELVRDLRTGEKLLRFGSGEPPVRIAWAYPPNKFKWAVNTSYQGDLNEVPPETPIDETVRCGFIGTPSRPTKTSRNLLAFTKVDLPE